MIYYKGKSLWKHKVNKWLKFQEAIASKISQYEAYLDVV